MEYAKQPLTLEQQADQLLDRGLIAERDVLIACLRSVNYYRLSGYLHPFRQSDDTYVPGTSLETVWRRYTFDRRLRLLLLDPLERIEVSIRTALAYELAHAAGPFGYLESGNLPNLSPDRREGFLSKLREETKQSSETFVKHFQAKYADQHADLPIWMAVEIMSFGMTLTLFRGVPKPIKQRIAGEYGIADDVLFSWLVALNSIRNICAHHNRLWNRGLGAKPKIPRGHKHREWRQPVDIPNNRVFCVLTIAKYFLNYIAPNSQWPHRLRSLLTEYPEIPRRPMGFPDNWEDCPIWKS